MRHSLILLLCLVPCIRADQAADEALLRGARIGTDGPALVEFFCGRLVKSEADEKLIEGLVEKLSSGRFKEREKASGELIAIGVPARPALAGAISHRDAEVRKRVADCLAAIESANSADVELAALRLLQIHKPEGASKALLHYLPAVRDTAIEEELFQTLTVVGFRAGKGDESLVAALQERAALTRGLAHAGNSAQKEQVRQLLKKETDPLVRLRAAQGLLASKDKTGAAVLLPLLTDAPLSVAAQARDVLASVAEDKSPAGELSEEKASRQKCRDEWERWWDANQAKLDLAKSGIDLPWLNMNGRAKKVVLRWIGAIEKSNAEELKKTMDAPFSLAGFIVLNTRAELEQMFVQSLQQPRPQIQIGAPRIVELKKYLAEVPAGQTKDFLSKLPAAEMRVLYATAQEKGKPKPEGAYLFVRLRKGQAHIVGLAEDHAKQK
jgi:HEAT repeat protein